MEVSVIVQCHQDRGFVDEALQSALNQNFDDYEVILSSDGNPEMKKYADKYGVQFCLFSGHNHSASVNNAVNHAKGEFIKVLDDDDTMLPDCLKDLSEAIGGCDLIQANANIVYEDQSVVYKGKEITIESLLPIITNPTNWSTVMFMKDSFLSFGGFDPDVHFANDYDLYLNMLCHDFKIGYCDKVVSNYRIHSSQLSSDADVYRIRETIYLMNKYADYKFR